MNALSLIPQPQLDNFQRLNDTAQRKYCAWGDCITELTNALDQRHQLQPLYDKWAARLSCSARAVRRKLSEWRNGTEKYPAGDWRILVDHARAGCAWQDTERDPLPEPFVDFWRGLCGENQRKCRPQRRALLRRLAKWRAGDPTAAIPGYDGPPANASGKDHPPGWSERNLYRPLANPQTRVELALQRIGTAAAIQLLPSIPGTRVGVRPFEYLMFDDVWQDRKIVVPGFRDPVRLLMLGCLDLASGVYLKFGLRPELPTRDDGTRERLKERDMKWLVAMVLERYGYPLDYDMHLVLEHGTATLREHDCRALHNWSGGRIKPCYSTMEGQLVLAWEERAKGNPRAKASLESLHNLFHNEAAALIGQVGKDRDHSPAALMGMEREARNLHTAACVLAPEKRAELKFPFAGLEQAHHETLVIWDRINSRLDHEIEGFENVLEWRLKAVENMPWQSETALARARDLSPDHPSIEWRSRKESPIERLARLAAHVSRGTIPPGLLCKFYEDCRVEKALSDNGLFEFDREGKSYAFGPAHGLRSDVKYLAHFPPVDPDHVHLTLDGAYIATLPRVRRIQRGDHNAIAVAIAQKQASLNSTVANVRRRNADRIAAEEQRMRHNLEVINSSNMLAEQSPAHEQSIAPTTPGAALEAAYQAEADLARERARTKEILSGRRRDDGDVNDFVPDTSKEPQPTQPTRTAADALSEFLP